MCVYYRCRSGDSRLSRMPRSVENNRCANTREPSLGVRKFGLKLVEAAADKPILDVACGAGRNAIFLSELGCTVICIDKDLTELRQHQTHQSHTSAPKEQRLELCHLDLVNESWPFAEGSAGGIVNVHFFLPSLFSRFVNSLTSGGGTSFLNPCLAAEGTVWNCRRGDMCGLCLPGVLTSRSTKNGKTGAI